MNRSSIAVFEIIREILGDDTEMTSAMYLGADLGFGSLDFVRLAGLLQKRFPDRDLSFQSLMIRPDGSLVTDLRIEQLLEHLG